MTNKNDRLGLQPNNTLQVEHPQYETGAQALARKLLEPHLRHGAAASAFAQPILGKNLEKPGVMDFRDHFSAAAARARTDDLSQIKDMLMAQAITLDSMFTELARRAALNMGEYLEAAEKYARLALKAQNSSRAALEALANLQRPRESTVRHVHVTEGGQAIVADNLTYLAGGSTNAENEDQSHATRAIGSGTSLPGADPRGDRVPVTGG